MIQDVEMKNLLNKDFFNSKDMLKLISRYKHTSDSEKKHILKEEIFNNNIRFIRSAVLKSPLILKEDVEDAFNECVINFLIGIDRFKASKKCNFSTYIIYWINKGIYNFIRSKNIVTISKNAYSKKSTKSFALAASNGNLLYLDKIFSYDNDNHYEYYINKIPSCQNVEKEIFEKIDREKLLNLIKKNLNQKEIIFIRFKYFEEINWSNKDFSIIFNISRSWVDVFEYRVLNKIKNLLKNKEIREYLEEKPLRNSYIPSEKELQEYHEKVINKYILHKKNYKKHREKVINT